MCLVINMVLSWNLIRTVQLILFCRSWMLLLHGFDWAMCMYSLALKYTNLFHDAVNNLEINSSFFILFFCVHYLADAFVNGNQQIWLVLLTELQICAIYVVL